MSETRRGSVLILGASSGFGEAAALGKDGKLFVEVKKVMEQTYRFTHASSDEFFGNTDGYNHESYFKAGRTHFFRASRCYPDDC